MVNDQSVEEWAHSHPFSEPLRLAELEAGVLAREPAANTGMPAWVTAVGAVGWLFLAVAYLIGPGVSLLGLAAVWLAGREEPPGGADFWMDMVQLVFSLGALTYAFYLAQVLRAGHRKKQDLVSALVTVVACAASFLMLRSMASGTVPRLAWIAVLVMGGLGVALVAASLASKPREPKGETPQAPLRGPAAEREYHRYVRTRARVLDIVVRRGLLKVDEVEQGRMNAMPLGYWEELDGVDERERRRILEYAVLGWREFSEADRRPWPSPSTGENMPRS